MGPIRRENLVRIVSRNLVLQALVFQPCKAGHISIRRPKMLLQSVGPTQKSCRFGQELYCRHFQKKGFGMACGEPAPLLWSCSGKSSYSGLLSCSPLIPFRKGHLVEGFPERLMILFGPPGGKFLCQSNGLAGISGKRHGVSAHWL